MHWEFKFLDWIRKHENKMLTAIMSFFTVIGNGGLVWFAITFAFFIIEPLRVNGISIFFSAFLASGFANLVIKPLFSRARPCDIREDENLIIGKRPSGHSFPSGHSTTSFGGAVGGLVDFAISGGNNSVWIYGSIAIAIALMIAFSRMYLYVHFPTDVFAGILIGSAFGVSVPFAVRAIYMKFFLAK